MKRMLRYWHIVLFTALCVTSCDSQPYREVEISFVNPHDGIRIAGTMTIPATRSPAPGVILVGNGICDRDLTVGQHRTFRVIADHLARRGITVLRYDGRGVGKSEGKPWPAYTKQNLASDLRAAHRCLRDQPGVDPNHIGIVGHSEGGTVATIVAAESPDVAFLVMLGSPGLPGGDILCAQISRVAPSFGVETSTVARHVQLMQQAYKILQECPDSAAARRKLEWAFEAYYGRTTYRERESLQKSGYGTPDNARDFASGILLPWMKEFLVYDPLPSLKQIQCPVLCLIGEKDMQVSPGENNSAIRKALAAGGNRDYTVLELHDLNHLLQTARTGSPAEYEHINETIAPIALRTISEWILQRLR